MWIYLYIHIHIYRYMWHGPLCSIWRRVFFFDNHPLKYFHVQPKNSLSAHGPWLTSRHAVEPTHFEETMHRKCMQVDQACRSKNKQNKQKSFANPLHKLRSLTPGVTSPLPGVYIYIYIFFFPVLRLCLHLVISYLDTPFLDHMFP